MVRKLRTLAGMMLVGLWASAACTSKDPNATAGGEGGRSGSATTQAGSNSKAGRGGSAGTAGSKAGTDAGGAGGEAGAGPSCPGCDSGFCLDDGTCVDCLPSNDRCAQGQFCTEANECAPGCKTDGSSCASGVCDEDHNCTNCISDDECNVGLVCGNGQCGAACAATQEGQTGSCSSELTCCSLHCTDLVTDSNHCGACGATCQAGDFCGTDICADAGQGGAGGAGGASTAPCVTCFPTTLSSICAIAKVIVILDTSKNVSDGNRKPGRAIGAALKGKCNPTPELTEAEQDSVDALNITSGRPVSGGGELLVMAGGPFYQNLEGYLESEGIAPLYWHVTDTASEYRKTANDEAVVSLPIAGDHDSHDFFIIQFMRDPASGSLALNVQGLWLSGTVAATYQLTEGMLPNLASFDQAWYAYEWTDADGDKAPDLNEIKLVDSGS